jgi:hypothetical protein
MRRGSDERKRLEALVNGEGPVPAADYQVAA